MEIEIRGKFLAMSCDIEYTLSNIMAYCAPDPQNQIRRFKKMMMGEKIQNAVYDLKQYKPNYFAEYEMQLQTLEKFRVVRNDLSHHKMDFPDLNDLSHFRIVFVDEHNGEEQFMFKDYTIKYYDECCERFRNSNLILANLVIKLYNDFRHSNGLPPLTLGLKNTSQ